MTWLYPDKGWVRLKMISPWQGYQEPRYVCPICHRGFSGAAVDHMRMTCDWLGAKISFEFNGQPVEAEVNWVDGLHELMSVELEHPSLDIVIRGSPGDFPKLKVLQRPTVNNQPRGRANRWTYY